MTILLNIKYIDDVSFTDGDYLDLLYPEELVIEETTQPRIFISKWTLEKFYDKRDDLDFPIANYSFVCNNFQTTLEYGIFTSQLILVV